MRLIITLFIDNVSVTVFWFARWKEMMNTLKQARAKLIGKRQEICEIIKKNLALHWIKQHQII